MVKFLADIGRFNAVAIITLVLAAVSVMVTAVALAILEWVGLATISWLALSLAATVPLLAAPPIVWSLVDLLIDSFRKEQEMRQLASFDSLTGLPSRHAFFESANRHVSLANRNQSIFVVVLIDLDHFKAINDQYGHPAGDAVLRLFADVLNSVARRSDIIGRMGGEEFAMILPSTTTASALEFSERLHAAIGQAVLKYGESVIQYTVSIGIACSTAGRVNNLENLLTRADLALYQAKRGGRNQTRVFTESQERIAVG
ncbi:MAG TPA: GGDEF domain-containing protein [Gammaproteobacteria bacterium]|jgi:diguanylate cyclase (GGDEF)-like protein